MHVSDHAAASILLVMGAPDLGTKIKACIEYCPLALGAVRGCSVSDCAAQAQALARGAVRRP